MIDRLRNIADFSPVFKGIDIVVIKKYRSSLYGIKAQQTFDQRGFSGAVLSPYHQKIARVNGKGQIVDDQLPPVGEGKIVNIDLHSITKPFEYIVP
jgi:hypothetical protein